MTEYDDFSCVRFITALTPDTYTKKIIVISTVYSHSMKQGDTAIAHATALNSGCIRFEELTYKSIKKHTRYNSAKKFHNEYSLSMNWGNLQDEKI